MVVLILSKLAEKSLLEASLVLKALQLFFSFLYP